MNEDGSHKTKVTMADGKEREIDVITMLKKPGTDESFLIYTYDSTAENVDLYAATVEMDDDEFVLGNIKNEEDWNMVKKAIEELSSNEEGEQ